jgi:hypothetical protein
MRELKRYAQVAARSNESSAAVQADVRFTPESGHMRCVNRVAEHAGLRVIRGEVPCAQAGQEFLATEMVKN